MSALRVGFIGTGKKPVKASGMGYGMAQMHAMAYQALSGQAEIVACADISRENAESFAEIYKIPGGGVYTDYNEMLAKEKLDVVSICTWPKLHAPMAIDAAKARVKGIYCEKPMADSYGAALRMHQAAQQHGTKLCFNHQRRYGKPFRLARKLIDEGAIGTLERVEFTCGDIYDYGTHSIDLSNYLAGPNPVQAAAAKWVMAQIDYRELKVIFGAHCENQVLMQWEYESGVLGFSASGPGAKMVGAHNKAIGSDGVIEIGSHDKAAGSPLRIRKHGKNWENIDTAGEHCHGPGYIERAVADFIGCIRENRECELGSANAMKATEMIFAAYHSSRIHGRVDLPLMIEDHPLVAMMQDGRLKPVAAPKAT